MPAHNVAVTLILKLIENRVLVNTLYLRSPVCILDQNLVEQRAHLHKTGRYQETFRFHIPGQMQYEL
jgi:hypothetical protein